jgi:hypothetical protein
MHGSITQPPCSTSFDLPTNGDDDPTLAPVDGGDIEVEGDDADGATVVTSTNSKGCSDWIEYNIMFLISNKQDIANPALQQATMTALREISLPFWF